MRDWMICREAGTISFRIRKNSVLEWMRFCFRIRKGKPGDNVLDIGTGTGVIPILMAAKTKAGHFTGLEIQHESADMAMRSIRYNHLEERISIVEGDIKEAGTLFVFALFM